MRLCKLNNRGGRRSASSSRATPAALRLAIQAQRHQAKRRNLGGKEKEVKPCHHALSEPAWRRASAYGANGKRHLTRVGAGGRGRRAIAGRRRTSGSRQTRRGASGARSGIPRRRTATRIGSGCRGRRRGAHPERAMRARPAGPRAKTRHARTISPPPAEHTEAVCGDSGRTATRSRTCVRRAVAWTPESPEMHRAHGCDEIARTLTRQQPRGMQSRKGVAQPSNS